MYEGHDAYPVESPDNAMEEQQENITFGDTDPAAPLDIMTITDRTRAMRDDTIAHLGTYLSRPVLINTFTWAQSTTGTDLNSFLPWTLFFNDSRIKSKLVNFARLQCNLRLKFILNASPFYYGLLKVNYDPLVSNRATGQNFITQTQLPGPYIAPQEMSSVEMKLPFFWPRDYLDICSIEDFNSMGKIYYNVIEQLQSANAVVAGQITISCYAWAEDIHLAAPTSFNALQGPIANTARTISNVAGALANIPPLAGIGSAVSAGAGMVSNLAAALGFSNEPNTKDVDPVQVKTFHAFANTEQKIPLDKLSLDPKNQVSMGPDTVGLGNVDELAVSEFCAHEAWIGRVAWTSSLATGTHLVSWFVTPHMQDHEYLTEPARNKFTMTPTRYLSRFYKYWRGSMIYRIKIVATQYHKGRIQISWDPEDSAHASVDTETTNITKIVDLDAEREIEFIVPYKGVRTWNSTNYEDQGDMPIKYTTGDYGRIPNKAEHNGAISVFVQNQLSGPVDPAAVQIVVFARAGPDFEVAGPVETIRQYSANIPQGPTTLDGGALENETEVTAFTVGERTSSIRQLLHRTVCYGLFPRLVTQGQGFTTDPAMWMSTALFPKVPRSYGYDDLGISWTLNIVGEEASKRANFVYETPTDAFTNCFAGYRGSVNWHATPIMHDMNDQPLLSIGRHPKGHLVTSAPTPTGDPHLFALGANMLQVVSTDTYPTDMAKKFVGETLTASGGRINNVDRGLGGMSLGHTKIQPFVSVNIPQYSGVRFQPAWIKQRDLITSSDRIYDSFRVDNTQFGGMERNRYMTLYTSAGVDFNLFYFVCVPPLWLYTMPDTGL